MATHHDSTCLVPLLAALATIALGELATIAEVPIRRASLFGFEVAGQPELLDAPEAAQAIQALHAEPPASTPTPELALDPDPTPDPAPELDRDAIEAAVQHALAGGLIPGTWSIRSYLLLDGRLQVAAAFTAERYTLGTWEQALRAGLRALAPFGAERTGRKLWMTFGERTDLPLPLAA